MRCKKQDPIVKAINEKGYVAVKTPRTGLDPWVCIYRSKEANKIGVFGELNTFWQSEKEEKCRPEPEDDDAVGFNLDGTNSSRVKGNVGLLNGFLSQLGGASVNAGAIYGGSRSFSIQVVSPVICTVDPTEVSNWLQGGELNLANSLVHSAFVKNEMEVYLIHSVIKSQKLLVKVFDERETELELAASDAEGIVEGNLGVKKKNSSSSSILYSGEKYLTFGYDAMQLIYSYEKGNEKSGLLSTQMVNVNKALDGYMGLNEGEAEASEFEKSAVNTLMDIDPTPLISE